MGTYPDTGNTNHVTRTFKGTERQADRALAEFVAEVSQGSATKVRAKGAYAWGGFGPSSGATGSAI
jgi:hypothetical protein